MKIEKFFIFLILIAFLVSVGGVSAENVNNTDSDAVVGVDAVLTDTLYAEENNEDLGSVNTTTTNIEVLGDNSLDANFSCDVDEGIGFLTVNFKDNSTGKPTSWLWDFGDGNTSTEQNPTHTYTQWGSYNVSLNVSDGDVSSCMVKHGFIHVYQLNSQLVNLDFEESGTLVGWDYKKASITTNFRYAKNGIRYASLQNNGSISQFFNFDIVDSLSFWYMSSNKNATINVLIDDECVSEYTIKKTGNGKWEQVFVNLTNYTGYHTLKFYQNVSSAYIDYINVGYNSVLVANFTPVSFNATVGGLMVSFEVEYIGLISSCLWDFGDGTYSTELNPIHTFKLGNQTVTLALSNKNNSYKQRYSWSATLPRVESSGLEYESIQEAIDNAVEGDTITITSCDYYDKYFENLVIDKSLTLDFNNCTLVGDGANHTVCIAGNNIVKLNNLSFENVALTIGKSSNLIIQNLNSGNVNFNEGNFKFKDCNLSNVYLTIKNANVNITNTSIVKGSIIVNGGKTRIVNSSFSFCDVAISQMGGELELTSNILFNNTVGVNVTGGSSILSFNALYYNNISLIYNVSDIVNVNNWWGKNNPIYHYNNVSNCDVCQLGGIENPLVSWLVLNITQSDVLDYDYWIAGITYYNLTVDLTHNNHGEDTSSYGKIKDWTLDIISVDRVIYYVYHQSGMGNYNVETIWDNIVNEKCYISEGKGGCIFSLGYLTNDLDELNISIFDENFIIPVSSNSNSPVITYITPSSIFDDNITIEITYEGLDSMIFYTLDGSNPGYSSTRFIYKEPIVINESSTVHYTAIDKWGNFQKVLLDTISDAGIKSLSFIKQDVFVELSAYTGNLYYSVDGKKFEESMSNFDGFIYYYHPFIIHEPTVINFAASERYFDYGEFFATNNIPIIMKSYSFEFSSNYMKNSSIFYNSDAIWSQYQGNINNTGVTNYTGPLTNQTSWFNDAVISSASAVVDNNNHVIVSGSDGYLYCLNSQGLVIWRFGTTSRIICTPTIGADGNIYFTNWMDSNFYCISPEGQLIWKYELGDYNTATSPVFGLDNKLYLITSNSLYSRVYVLEDGKLLFNNTIPFISGSNPTISDKGFLYLVSTNHELVILNFDGSLNKAFYIDDGAIINLDVQDTQISVSMDSDGILYVLNYYRSAYMDFYSSGKIYENTHDVGLDSYYLYYYIVNAYYPNGTQMWTNFIHYDAIEEYLTPLPSFEEHVSGTPSIYNDTLYITGNDNLIAVNASNGDILWMKPISSSGLTASSPLVSGDEVLYVTSNNMVYAFNLSGELIWQYEMIGEYGNPISFSSPTLTGDGTLIVTTNQGIYAFKDIAADFTYSHINGTETSIQFSDLSTDGSVRCFWDFGDGNYSFDENPIHEYASEGKYRVVLLKEYENNLTLARNKTVRVIFHDITPPSNITAYIDNNLTMGGVFNQTQIVRLNASDDHGDVVIYYTVDGSNPINSTSRRLYQEPLKVEVDTVLNIVAQDLAGNYGNVSIITFNITDALNVHDEVNSTLVSEIQELLDNAEPYSKIFFDYDVLEGVNFIVKKPLNLISNKNTKLIGNSNQAVFTFTDKSNGSVLNGFDISNIGADGILINNTSNVIIQNCIINTTNATGINIKNSTNITVKDSIVTNALDGILVNSSSNTKLNSIKVNESYNNGIWIYQSTDTLISNSLLESNGKDWFESKANQILIDDSNNTVLINNTLNYGFFGVHLYHTTHGVVMDYNTIYESTGDAILLSNEYYDVNITHNTIDGCYNGIDFMGFSQNVYIANNLIENLHEHENDLYIFVYAPLIEQMAGYVYETYFPHDQFFRHHYNGIQISYPASNFHEGNVTIIDNVVIKLGHRAWEARKYQHTLDAGCAGYGYNLMDGSGSYYNDTTGATHYTPGKVDLVVDRIGDATFRLRLINRLDDHFLSEIPEFYVTFRAGGFTQTVKFVNDSAIATFDVAMAVSDVEAIISTEIRKSAHFDMPITEGYTSTNKENDSGFEEGEAIHNPNPVVPRIDDYIRQHFPEAIDNPGEDILDVIDNPVNGTAPGNGTGSGNGSGNGSQFGTGSGTGIGNGTGSGVGTGNGTTFNPNGGNPSDSSNSNSEVSPDGNIGSAGGSSGSDGSKAYEVTKAIDIENTSMFALVIFLLAVFFFIIGWRRGGSEDDEEL